MLAKVLIVQEDQEQRRLLEEVLGIVGFQVCVAGDCSTGMQLLDSFVPDILLVDVDLPDIPGIALLRHVTESPQTENTPVIVLSAEGTEEIRVICLSNGAHDFVVKPVGVAEITTRIQNALELRNTRQRLRESNIRLERDKKILTRYFSADFVEGVLAEDIPAELGRGSIVDATVMFFDLRGSTGIAERIGPENYTSLVNGLFSEIMDIVTDEGGSVNDLLGDGIIATFGLPFRGTRDASAAVTSALKIRAFMEEHNRNAIDNETVAVGFGIGIASGRFFSGNVGSDRRIKFAVLGDPVNLAARLQSLTKQLGEPVLFDDETRSRLEEEIIFRKLGSARVRGKEHAVRIFAPVAPHTKEGVRELAETINSRFW